MGASSASEIPLLLTLFYLLHEVELGLCPLLLVLRHARMPIQGGRHCHVGSLLRVAHLLKDELKCPKMSSTRTEISCGTKG